MRRAVGFLAFAALLALSGCVAVVGSGPRYRRGWGPARPRLVLIAGTGIQYVADVNDDIFLYGGLYYRFYGGGWYHCRSWGGSWARIAGPPVVFYKIPPRHAKYRVIRGRKPPPGRPHRPPPPPKHRPPPPKHHPGKGPKGPGKGPKDPGKGPKHGGKGGWK